MFAGNNPGRSSTFVQETLHHVNDLSSRVARIFTSSANTEALHQGIRYRVHVESGGRYTIGRQSDTELAIVMRSVLLQYGNNNDDGDVLRQVRGLNKMVLDYCVDKVLTELEGYGQYLRDASTLATPMERARPASVKGLGERSLEYGNSRFI